MKYLLSKTNDPYYNLATEEYLIKNIKESIFYLYQNSPSVIIGKNQNPHSEVGINYIKKNNILLVRRLSGGGAVYHDLGNLNYGFVLKNGSKNLYDFKKYCQPIVDVLNTLNLNVKFTGRNDLVIEDKKISGSAQYVSGNNLLHHGTLLFDVDFSNISKILIPNDDKLKSKGVKSVSSRVTNIKKYLNDNISFEDLIKKLWENISNKEEYILTKKDINEIEKISQDKRKSISFILKNNKQYENQIAEYIPGFGTIEIYFNVKNNKISSFEIFGEYFFKEDITVIKNKIIGVEFTEDSIKEFIYSIDNFENYFHKLSKDKFLNLIIEGGKLL